MEVGDEDQLETKTGADLSLPLTDWETVGISTLATQNSEASTVKTRVKEEYKDASDLHSCLRAGSDGRR